MNFLGSLLAGVLLAAVETAARARLGAFPDLGATALALLLLAADSAGPRRTGARCAGLLLGASSGSLDPVGATLLGGGLAAVALVTLRRIVFGESATTQAVFGATAAIALALGRTAYGWVGLAPSLPFGPASWTTPLLTAAAVPILAQVGSGLRRVARRSRDRFGAGGEEPGGAAPP